MNISFNSYIEELQRIARKNEYVSEITIHKRSSGRLRLVFEASKFTQYHVDLINYHSAILLKIIPLPNGRARVVLQISRDRRPLDIDVDEAFEDTDADVILHD